MMRNEGICPGMVRGRRVRAILFGGLDSAAFDPPHWPADTLDWTIRPEHQPSHRFDIKFFEVVA